MSASGKESFLSHIDRFLSPKKFDKPILFEVFTEKDDESNSLKLLLNIIIDPKEQLKKRIKSNIKSVLGENTVNIINKVIR